MAPLERPSHDRLPPPPHLHPPTRPTTTRLTPSATTPGRVPCGRLTHGGWRKSGSGSGGDAGEGSKKSLNAHTSYLATGGATVQLSAAATKEAGQAREPHRSGADGSFTRSATRRQPVHTMRDQTPDALQTERRLCPSRCAPPARDSPRRLPVCARSPSDRARHRRSSPRARRAQSRGSQSNRSD